MAQYYCCIIFLLFGSLHLEAQNNQLAATMMKSAGPGTVTGRVIDSSSGAPIEYASAILLSAQTAQMVNGIATDKNGLFTLRDIPSGAYNLSITFLGFQRRILPVTMNDTPLTVDLTDIKLQALPLQVEGAVILAERSTVEFKLDKKVINVGQNLAAAGGTAVDVLQNQPSIQVDAGGNVSMRGSGSFSVMVDGRPSVLSGTDALRQIPANAIDNIELITNPSAKYDAEGTAGIINIITKKSNLTSTSGLMNLGAGSRDKYNGDLYYSQKTDRMRYWIGADGRRSTLTNDILIDRSQLQTGNVHTDAAQLNRRDIYNVRIGIDTYLNEQLTVGVTGAYGSVDAWNSTLVSNRGTPPGAASPSSFTNSDDHSRTMVEYFNGALHASYKFEPKVNDLTFDATGSIVQLPTAEFISNDSILANGTTLSTLRQRENNTSRVDGRIKLFYKHVFPKKNTFEAGMQTNLFKKEIDIIGRNFDPASQQWHVNMSLSNTFNFRNNIYAAYSTYADRLWGFEYQTGVRLEYSDRVLDQTTTGERFAYQELHVFPSMTVSRKLSEDQQIQISYSRRIRRPGDGDLNPYPGYSDAYTLASGNPYLLPSFTHSVELNYQRSWEGVYLVTQTYARKTDDGIEQTQKADTTGRIVVKPENALNTLALGAEISANVTFTSWLKMDPVLNLYHFSLEAKPAIGVAAQNRLSWDARLNTTVMISGSTRFQFLFSYFPAKIASQGETESFMIIGATLRQEFFNRSFTATLSAQNLFGQTANKTIAVGSGFTSSLDIRPEAPIVTLTLSYNFNNFKRPDTDQPEINLNSGL